MQLGGGIRTFPQIEDWLDRGLARVILGTVAVREPDLVKEACRKFPGKIAVGIDARGGKVAVEGWAEASSLGVIELAKKFEGAGVAAIIYTDIDRDGVLTGINWEATIALAEAVSIPVIASGGLASLDDIRRMTKPDAKKLAGAISGRALYDGRIDPAEALAILRETKTGSLDVKLSIIVAPYDSGRRHEGFGKGPDALLSGGLVEMLSSTATMWRSRRSARSRGSTIARSRPASPSARRWRRRSVKAARTGAFRWCCQATA